MVDETVQAAKTAAVLDAIRRIREVLPASVEQFHEDRTAREIVTLNLFVAIQECLDLASHWLADAGLSVPPRYGDVFLALADHGPIERPLAQRLAAAAGLRNLIAHQYGAIDPSRLHAAAINHLDDLADFCRALAAHRSTNR
jgi:uncharacterized protein YutE (UPF0331/DUF86 family)